MLKALFTLLDQNPSIYWTLAAAAMLVLLAWALRPQRVDESLARRSPWLGALAIGLTLLAWRWPWLLSAVEFNPDESQLIAGTMALAHDPVFWRSVDGTTSGPLNYYALWPIAWFGLPLDFFTGRLAGLMMAGAGCFALYRALARSGPEAAARLAVLLPVIFLATTIDADFVHYSSEHVTLLLAPVALWLIVRYRTHARGGTWNLGFAAIAAGAIPWAKLQGVPIAVVLLLWIAWLAWTSTALLRDRAIALAGVTLAGLATTLLFAVMTALGGVFDLMLHRYVLQNASYVDAATEFRPSLPGLFRLAAEFGQFLHLGLTAIGLSVVAGLVLLRRKRSPDTLLWIALAWLAAATFAIALPRREFLHYLLLAVTPLSLLAGWALGELWRSYGTVGQRVVLAGFLGLGVVVPLAQRAQQGPPAVMGSLLDHWRKPAHGDAAILRALRRPGDSLAIWGWSARTYIEAQMPQATRDTHTFWATAEEPGRDPHRQVFLADFRASRPPFFVDATGEGAFFYTDRARYAHESFPELAAEVRTHYAPVIDLGYARVYVRLDRLAERPLPPAEAVRLAAQARQVPAPWQIPPQMTHVDGARAEMLDHRPVLVLPAPARAYVILDPTTRALDLRARFHPRAIAEGSSDGAEIAVELVDVRGEHRIFQERIAFSTGAGLDRRIVLPPFAAGTHVQIRALPGPHHNNAWDWLVVENLREVKRTLYTAEQFPQFNRLPSRAEFDFAEIVATDSGAVFVGQGSGSLEFPLLPTDRRLRAKLHALDSAPRNFLVERIDSAGHSTELARGQLESLPRQDGHALLELSWQGGIGGDRLRLSLRTTADGARVIFQSLDVE